MSRGLLTLFLGLCSLALPSSAGAEQSDFRQIETGQAVALRADRAYILIRCAGGANCALPMLLRVPSDEESRRFHEAKLQAWQKKGSGAPPFETFPFELKGLQNLYLRAAKHAFERRDVANTMLIETLPGDYVVYGIGWKQIMMMCFCLGTVSFNAPAGQITDAGTFLAGRAGDPSPFPELAEVTNLGPTMDVDFPLAAGAIRPFRASDPIPAALLSLPRSPARFRAVGPYLEPSARGINRLAPIPGVLSYDHGNVVDVQSGQTMPPH